MPKKSGTGLKKTPDVIHNYGISINSNINVNLILLIILIVVIIKYRKQIIKKTEKFFGSGKKYDVFIFIADWCPYCKKAKPIIEDLKNNPPKNINVIIVNEKDSKSKELMEKYNVRGYPTIISVKDDGNFNEFNKTLNSKNLNDFVRNI